MVRDMLPTVFSTSSWTGLKVLVVLWKARWKAWWKKGYKTKQHANELRKHKQVSTVSFGKRRGNTLMQSQIQNQKQKLKQSFNQHTVVMDLLSIFLILARPVINSNPLFSVFLLSCSFKLLATNKTGTMILLQRALTKLETWKSASSEESTTRNRCPLFDPLEKTTPIRSSQFFHQFLIFKIRSALFRTVLAHFSQF